jgi:hypothetical protein
MTDSQSIRLEYGWMSQGATSAAGQQVQEVHRLDGVVRRMIDILMANVEPWALSLERDIFRRLGKCSHSRLD